MCASHDADRLSTGRPVTGVFQTLSDGNAGQSVPGRTWPLAATGIGVCAPDADEPVAATAAIAEASARSAVAALQRAGTPITARRLGASGRFDGGLDPQREVGCILDRGLRGKADQ
jgi:hypothetical protein